LSGDSSFALPPLLCTLVALVAGPLLAVLVFWVLLRRYSVRHGPLFRVEFAGAPAMSPVDHLPAPASVPPVSADVPPAVEPRPRPVVVAPPPQPTETFSFGPTCKGVFQQKLEELRNHEEGILRHLVEQNVKLREQIGELESAALS
jgi:hypothetical protein